MGPPLLQAISVVVVATVVTGCSGSALDERLAAYHARVAAILADGPAPRPPPGELPRVPRRRDRLAAIDDRRINGFDFLAIQGCRLSELVGRRNGPMGRVMPPSRRLIYELEVIDSADACIETLGPERAAKFQNLFDAKRRELPAHVFNAVWAGEELEDFLSGTPQPRAFANIEPVPALDEVARLLRGPVRTRDDGEALEAALGRVGGARPIGPMLRELDDVRRSLDAVAKLVVGFRPDACRGDAVRLATVFDETYLPLQHDLAALDRRASMLLTALARVLVEAEAPLADVTLPDGGPEALRAYRDAIDPDARDGVWQRYRDATVRHALAWETVLTRCGRLPG